MIAAEPAAQVAEICIQGVIGSGFYGVTADDVLEQLAGAAAAELLLVRVNCTGGDVFEAARIFNAIRRHDATAKVVIVEGYADSAASWLMLAADVVLLMPNATVTMHNAAPGGGGSAQAVKAMTLAIAEIYQLKSGRPAGWWMQQMAASRRFNADELVQVGLADEVLVPGASNATDR